MKPIIIYTLPRTRSTATLQACKRTIKNNEPFHHLTLYGKEKLGHLYAQYANSISEEKWISIVQKMNYNDSVTKFFGGNLYTFAKARYWFEQSIENNSHDIYVLIRDFKEQALSYLLATVFGWLKTDEKGKILTQIEIPDRSLSMLSADIDAFLRFLPSNATLITFDNLPADVFDKSQITHVNQYSTNKLKYITNLDYCLEHIEEIRKFYEYEWNTKIEKLKKI